MTDLCEQTRSIRDRGRKGLAPFFTAGYPDENTFLQLIEAASRAGSDVIEIGIPFSDPIADGPLIQASSQEALARGMTLDRVLALTGKTAARTSAALILMGYFNPVLQMGPASFANQACAAGAGGAIIPDLPLEEAGEVRETFRKEGLTLVDLVAPNSGEERIARIARTARGFLYLVSVTGVTGVRKNLSHDLGDFVGRVRAHSDLPLYVGFGVSDAEMAANTVKHADGVIIGSALVRIIRSAKSPPEAVTRVEQFLNTIRTAIDQNQRSEIR
ncbi:MAG: tryptophan synthase subunit alpha [Planctomycetes bacterium]|nr:tryptophan synthase subunit alpha [Planctomycetota bacterium]